MYYQKNCDMDHGVKNFNILKFFLNKKDLSYYIALNSNQNTNGQHQAFDVFFYGWNLIFYLVGS